jgi:hypothetical protein
MIKKGQNIMICQICQEKEATLTKCFNYEGQIFFTKDLPNKTHCWQCARNVNDNQVLGGV